MNDQKRLTIEELDILLDNGMAVYQYYIDPNIKVKRKMKSPLPGRVDRIPSFCLYHNNKTGNVHFTDFGGTDHDKGNHWTFVQQMFGLDFKESVAKVKQEVLNIQDDLYENVRQKSKAQVKRVQQLDIPKESEVKITTERREWSKRDIDWFARFRITEKELHEFHVFPLNSFTMDKPGKDPFTISATYHSPMYEIFFPQTGHVKIYRPLEKGRYKWTSNTNAQDDIFGLDRLPDSCEHLFILAGNKDVMSFTAVTGYPAIALASESATLPLSLYQLLKMVAKNIYVLYDNDEKGHGDKYANRLAQDYYLPVLNGLLKPYGEKDFAALVDNQPRRLGFFLEKLEDTLQNRGVLQVHV